MSAALFTDTETRAVYLQLVGSAAAHPPDFLNRALDHFETRCSLAPQGSLTHQAESFLLLALLRLQSGELEAGAKALDQSVSLDSRLQKS